MGCIMRSLNLTRRQAIAAAAAGLAAHGQSSDKPNIVFIVADDLGYADVSCYGRREYKTPNIDSLATNGMKFLQAYANSAVCSATRTGLMTGRYQYRLAVGQEEPIPAADTRSGLPPEHPTLPSRLKKAGYGTTLIGKWHLGRLPGYSPLRSGYDHFWGFRAGVLDYFTHKYGPANTDTDDLWEDDVQIHQTGYLTDLIGDRAVKTVGDYARARQPFLLSLHFNAPHWPWEGPADAPAAQRIRPLNDRDGGSLKTYAQMVTRMDFQIGRVLKAVDDARIANNTIVIFTSDNGGERFSDMWPFFGRKGDLWEGGLRIPQLVRWPGRIRAGRTTEQAAITMDWVPTLFAAAGAQADPSYPMDGMNLLPLLTSNAAAAPRKLFWRFRQNNQRALRDGDMKWLKIGANDFLFNVVEDPRERANLKDRQPEIHQRMAAEFEAWNATMLPFEPQPNPGGARQ